MNFQDYKDFTIEDFLEDAYFCQSVLTPNSESERFWQEFIIETPEQQETIEEARKLLLDFKGYYHDEVQKVSKEQAQASFQRLEAKMQKYRPTLQISRRQWIAWSAAACVLLLLGVTLFFLPKEENPIVYATGNGERTTLQLPDQSEVQLNANSKLHFYPDRWKKEGQREVWLEGEAFFKVERKATGEKFLVHAGEVNISVLGTQFNVRSRGEDAKVMLAEGKVELAVADRKITMKPGDLLSYSKSESKVELEQVKTEDYMAWKDGISVFNNTLREVVKELEILYGVQFVIEDEQLKDRRIQLSAPNDSLEQVLETLELLYPDEIRIKEEEGQMIIF